MMFNKIKWPNQPMLKDEKLWTLNVEFVKMLCKIGKVTKLINKESDYHNSMPYHYDVDGVEIKFLPHWGFYSVGGINLKVPNNQLEVLTAIRAVKTLQSLGLK